jgi:5'-nucleotidase
MEPALKIVVTNDDGYDQPGLAALVEAISHLGDITVVAPSTPQSNIGHRVTMKDPIRVEQTQPRTYIVHGTPADCSRLAVKQFLPGVDWIIAGINPGANLGSDVYQSGTVAAAREAAILGVRAVAVSQYIARDWTVDWAAARTQVRRCLPAVLQQSLAAGQFWNINLPSPMDADSPLNIRFCSVDTNPHRYRFVKDGEIYRYEGIIHNRPRSAGSDVDVCFGGDVSVSRLEI